jgi:hypothetical protein
MITIVMSEAGQFRHEKTAPANLCALVMTSIESIEDGSIKIRPIGKTFE